MNVRELNDEQAEQLGKVFDATVALYERIPWPPSYALDAAAYREVRKLQEMLRPPKQYLVIDSLNQFEYEPQTAHQIHMRGPLGWRAIKALYEWQDGVGTVGKPITGEALRELLEGDSK